MRLLLLLLLSIGFISVDAQVTLSLEDCIRLAQERNLNLRSAQLNVKMAEVDVDQSKMARLPNLNAQTGANYYSGRAIDPTTNDFITETFLSNDMALSSGVTIFNANRLNNQIKQDQLGLQRNLAQYDQAYNDIALNVVLTFLNVISGQEAVENAEAQLEITIQQIQDLEDMIEAGIRAPNDVLDLRVQLSQGEQNLQAVQNQLNLDKLNLKQLIRWEGDESIEVETPDLEQFRDLNLNSYTLKELYERALTTQPIVQAQELAVAETELGIDIAKAAYWPSLSANAVLNTRYSDAARSFDTESRWVPFSFRIDDQPVDVEILQSVPVPGEVVPVSEQWNQNLGYGAGLSLSIPIFNRHMTSGNVQRSKIQSEMAKVDLAQTRDQLKQDVETAFVAAKNAEKAWLAAQKSLEATQAAFENMQRRYDVGNATNLELTTARINMENAQRDNLSAKYSYIFNVKVLDFYIGKDLKF